MTETYKIGRIGKTHGVKGEVTFHFTDDVFDRVDADYVFIETEGIPVPFFFEEYRFRNEESAIVKFEGIDTADRAAELTGCDVYFPRELSDEEDGELTWSEIVGFDIMQDGSQHTLGTVTSVDLTTINTLFELRTPDGKSLLIPANDDFITGIDRDARCITMRLPEGLLDI